MKILASSIDEDYYYYGKEEFEKYGELVYNILKNRAISKRKCDIDEVCGLRHEASMIGMNMIDLLRTLEGLCYNNMAAEVTDGIYIVGKPGERTG